MDSKYEDPLNLEKSIKASFKIFESFYDTNDVDDAIKQTEALAEHDLFHSATKSILSIFKSALTVDPIDIENASKSATKTVELCDKYRRRGIIENILKYIRTPDYNQYSEIELHAELIFAMIMGYSSVLSLTNSHTIIDFIRIVNRLRLSKNSFKECRLMFENHTDWDSETSKINFEAGISVERGCRHLIISLLPPKILRLVNFFGYRGVRSIAFSELNGTTFELTGIYSKMSETLLLIFHLYIETFISIEVHPSVVCKNILKHGLKVHPNYRIQDSKGQIQSSNGPIKTAIVQFENSLRTEFQYFHKLSHFELMWCHAFRCDWDQCIKYSQLLRQFALISPTLFTYFEAVFRYVKSVETNNLKLKEEATELFRTIPSLRTLYFGFTPTFELMAIEYSKIYIKNDEFLLLPVIELLYSWNYFVVILGDIPLLSRLLKTVERELKYYTKELNVRFYADNYLMALFYKGVILKFMGKLDEAQHCFDEVLYEKERIEKCQSLVPQAVMEMGLIQMYLHNYEEAKKLLNQTLDDYSGYLTEFILHTRIYPALREMGVNTDMVDVVEKKIVEEYKDVLHEVEVMDNSHKRHELMRL